MTTAPLFAAVLAACAVASLPVAAHAQTTTPVPTGAATSPTVPQNHWAYAAVEAFATRGFLTRAYGVSSLSAGGAMTRFEFGVATARIADLLAGPSEAATDTPQARWLHYCGFDLLQMLTHEFAPEMSALGVNVPKLKQSVAARVKSANRLARFVDAALSLGASPNATMSATGLPLVETDHWAYGAMPRLMQWPVKPMYNGQANTQRKFTRVDFALMTVRLAALLPRNPTTAERKAWAQRRFYGGFDTLGLLVREFAPEFPMLAPSDVAVRALVAAYDTPAPRKTLFPDAPPPGHWAAASVEKVRQAGVLVGYENGSLNGCGAAQKGNGRREQGGR